MKNIFSFFHKKALFLLGLVFFWLQCTFAQFSLSSVDYPFAQNSGFYYTVITGSGFTSGTPSVQIRGIFAPNTVIDVAPSDITVLSDNQIEILIPQMPILTYNAGQREFDVHVTIAATTLILKGALIATPQAFRNVMNCVFPRTSLVEVTLSYTHPTSGALMTSTTYTNSGGIFRFEVPEFNPGQTALVTLCINISSSCGGPVCKTITLNATGNYHDTNANSNCLQNPVTCDLAVTYLDVLHVSTLTSPNSTVQTIWQNANPTCANALAGYNRIFSYVDIYYKNLANTASLTQTLTVTLPRRYDFTSALDVTGNNPTPIIPTNNITPRCYDVPDCGNPPIPPAQTVIFPVPALQAGEERKIRVFLNIRYLCSGSMVDDDVTRAVISTCTGDCNLANNTKEHIYRYPYDPNHKNVFPRGVGRRGYISAGTELSYQIDFENKGLGIAQNVGIVDTIDEDLDISTFKIEHASHDVNFVICDGNILTFIFRDINLSDSTQPETAMGHIRYKISTKNNLSTGTIIKNRGYIYFDLNDSIRTNATINTIGATAQIQPKIFLEGAYNGTTMNSLLSANNLLPEYLAFDFRLGDMDNIVARIPLTNVVDWVLLELRPVAYNLKDSAISRKAALLLSDGNIIDAEDGGAVTMEGVNPGDYYLVIRHRNHLAIESATPISLSPTPTNYDFTTSATSAMGGANALKALSNGKFGMYTGDVNANGQVQSGDNILFKAASGLSGYRQEDATLNGQVQPSDGIKIKDNAGKGVQFPD
ncbi:MAG: DUF7619 domain-containing protein [Leadbetterella sp.]